MKKERPILMSAPMVRALLDGSKTQTRRIVKFPITDRNGTGCEIAGSEINSCLQQGLELCPYGIVGSKLWVRETFKLVPKRYCGAVFFRSDGEEQGPGFCWKPSIFMPRWASRITLEITGVRVERLTDISEADAESEGVIIETTGLTARPFETAKEAYEKLWESINGKGSWALNPWVWCISFKRV